MKFIWEVEDFESNDNWGLMAKKGEEIVIIGGKNVTSLRDGHTWGHDSYEDMCEAFNKHGYVPILAPVNPSLLVKQGIKRKWGYLGEFTINDVI